MTKDITLTVSSENLIDAVLQSDEFGKAVQTVVREEMANDILEILVSEADIFSSDEFKDGVEDIISNKIDRQVEREVEGIDFNDMIRDALPDLGNLEDEVESLEENVKEHDETIEGLVKTVDLLVGLVKGLQEQNHAMYSAIGEIEKQRFSNRIKTGILWVQNKFLVAIGYRSMFEV